MTQIRFVGFDLSRRSGTPARFNDDIIAAFPPCKPPFSISALYTHLVRRRTHGEKSTNRPEVAAANSRQD